MSSSHSHSGLTSSWVLASRAQNSEEDSVSGVCHLLALFGLMCITEQGKEKAQELVELKQRKPMQFLD